MSRPAVDLLRDIVVSVALAKHHAVGLDAKSLADAAERRDAVLFRLAVVCEAASRLPPEIQALAPEIPWANIRDMRNYIVHSYWQIDFGIVIDTIQNDLGPLSAAVERLIPIVARGDL
jgi:uncharacterized protein with HEPN domain